MTTGTESDASDDRPRDSQPEARPSVKDEARDLSASRRSEQVTKILADADRRDEDASIRDAVSDEREQVADRRAFSDPDGDYLGQGQRRASALDRADSKSDRESSADDRAHLAEDLSSDAHGGDVPQQ